MKFFIVKVDQFIGEYDPVETVHLIATDQDIQDECIDLLSGLWIDRDADVRIYKSYVEFIGIDVNCETTSIKEIDEQTFDLLKGLGL